jgi:hypothetical protein
MHYGVRFILAVLFCLGSMRAHADAGTAWHCWYDGQAFVHCLLQSVGPDRPAVVAAPAQGSRALPAVVRTIRNDPVSLKDQSISIPLHTIPYDMDFVQQLALSVMCGSQTGCTVAFEAAPRVSRNQENAAIAR